MYGATSSTSGIIDIDVILFVVVVVVVVVVVAAGDFVCDELHVQLHGAERREANLQLYQEQDQQRPPYRLLYSLLRIPES